MDWVTLVVSATTSSLFAAVISVFWEHRRERRSELLGAYSVWMETIDTAMLASHVFLDKGSRYAPVYVKQMAAMERLYEEFKGAFPPAPAAHYQSLKADLEADLDRLERLRMESLSAELRLAIAMNRVSMVEGRSRFRDQVASLSRSAFLKFPAGTMPPAMAELKEAYLKRTAPLKDAQIGALISEVIEAYRFRGFGADGVDRKS